jgi:excisionase family DNA binding protein
LNTTTTTNPARLLLTIPEAAQALGLGRSTLYELIAAGRLEVVHIGRSTRVPVDALDSFLAALRHGQAGKPVEGRVSA